MTEPIDLARAREQRARNSIPDSHLYSREQGTEFPYWPPTIVWGREQGWLNVQDPRDGTWFSIPAKEAPTGWARIAMAAKRR